LLAESHHFVNTKDAIVKTIFFIDLELKCTI